MTTELSKKLYIQFYIKRRSSEFLWNVFLKPLEGIVPLRV